MSTLGLYFHTVRYLRPRQITARICFRLHKPRIDLRAAPRLRMTVRAYASPIAPAAAMVGSQTFRLLNMERDCANAADWHPPGAEKLWIYNLHYFDDLNAQGAPSRLAWHQSLLARWVAENPPGQAAAWEPYPVSRRIVNWVKWALRGNTMPPQCVASLAVQARWLLQRLEYHILGNHLFTNAKALLYAGLYFEGAEAERWRSRSFAIIEGELREQVLADGGHFELSPMYHAAMLEDVLDLINVLQSFGLEVPDSWVAVAGRMRKWLHAMSHPDGEIAFFNDSAFGIAPTGASLDAYIARLGLAAPLPSSAAVTALRASGYVAAHIDRAWLICDCAAVGPDYLPGHAHADTLSFEFSLGSSRVFVNSGTSQYGVGAERQRQRGTAAHNTVVLDGQNSSEVWGGFRVARRARAVIHEVKVSSPAIVDASHDGYHRLRGRNRHGRRWTLDAGSLCIDDRVSGHFGSADAFFHLHPAVTARVSGADTVALSLPGGDSVQMSFDGSAGVEVRPGRWHPRFGVSVDNQHVVARFTGESMRTRMMWTRA